MAPTIRRPETSIKVSCQRPNSNRPQPSTTPTAGDVAIPTALHLCCPTGAWHKASQTRQDSASQSLYCWRDCRCRDQEQRGQSFQNQSTTLATAKRTTSNREPDKTHKKNST